MTQSLVSRLLKMNQAHRRWIALLLCVSVFLSLGVFALLHRTAAAKSRTTRVLACPYAAADAEPVAHVHDTECCDEDGTLLCTLPEIEPHTHTDACFEVQQVLCCDTEESDGHVHTDACYEEAERQICGLEESGGHRHTSACYSLQRGNLICDLADGEHEHTDACYAQTEVLSCGLAEGEGAHTHSDACFVHDRVLTCGLAEGEGAHQHTDACYAVELLPVCGRDELPVHTHTEACFRAAEAEDNETSEEKEEREKNPEARKPAENEDEEEPARPEKPESNPYADLETAEVWEKSLADVELSGNWAEDVLAIARSQIGYAESSENFDAILNASGDGYLRKGWTRYGAWYGYPYGDWCAMFVSFCLHYAEIGEEDFPYDCGTVPWVNRLRELEYYENSYQFTPKPGDR